MIESLNLIKANDAQIKETTRGDLVERYISNEVIAKLSPGDKLPSERDLAKTLGVAVQTINKILVSMSNSGIVYRKKGLGTFVAERQLSGKVLRLVSSSPDLFMRDKTINWYNSQFILNGFTSKAREYGCFVELFFMDLTRPCTEDEFQNLCNNDVIGYGISFAPNRRTRNCWHNV